MSIFRSIGNHGDRGYYSLQFLLAINCCATLWSIFALGEGNHLAVTSTLTICFVATVIGISFLAYMRQSLRHRLNKATIAEEEKQKLIRNDALTGAMTRRSFLEDLKLNLGSALEPNEVILLLVDLDHFKQLNDSFGHPFGDAVLCYLVESIGKSFPGCPIGRLGGDEFAVLVQDNDVERGRKRAARLMEKLSAGIEHEGRRVSLSASIGIAMAPLHAAQAKELMLMADLALYESKAQGRGRMTLFDGEMLSEKRHRRFIERELRAAIYLDQLELHYQPVMKADGSVLALEGLVRWRHPVRGIISPGEFVPIAESSNLIDVLGAWVFRRACSDIKGFPGCRIGINLSAEQLKRDEVVSMFARVLRETGCSADRFTLEITETAATAATPEILRRLGALRAMGFRIALDDFGTGHCGFNYLKTLPIDSIKIDRSYIQSLGHDDVARVFVSALAQIARIQKMSIVAEGIETKTEFDLAKMAGCDLFQGFFLGRPLPRNDIIPFFEAKRSIALVA